MTFFLCIPEYEAEGYKFEFITVSDIVKSVKKRFSEIDSYQANFKIETKRLEAKNVQHGIIKYKTSDKLLVNFHNPYGLKIISDGKTMWIYIPSMNVVAEQDLQVESGSLFFSQTKSGLSRLFSKYHYKFATKEQPELQKDGTKKYTLLLKQRESRSGYRTLKLWIREDYIITKAHGDTSTGKSVDIEFSNINTDINHPKGIFKFNIPSKARIIKNPIVSEE
ncbi:MAG: outer-membrane lipoprotein carrier protein LolA [Spirochaetota bacterium]|nr:outer-membrane lipoprotein carrier protein LolA [Spirochaetota bacterium]